MERPKVTVQPVNRMLTGEIVYLDEMRRAKQFPEPYENLPDMAIQMHEESAALLAAHGVRPDIMDAYDELEAQTTPLYASCAAMTEELLRLKNPDSPLTFVDIVVDVSASQVIEKLKEMKAGELLADDDAQLAIPSNGEYYPILDVKKKDAKLGGVKVVAWGWQGRKYAILGNGKERDTLIFPEDEKMSWYQLDVSFSYRLNDGGVLAETLTLSMGTQGDMRLYSNVWMSDYAETGYEGHGGVSLHDVNEEDIAAFADVIAEIVGDTPESTGMRQDRQLREFIDGLASKEASEAVQQLIDATWPAQALGLLVSTRFGETSLAKALLQSDTVEEATEAVKQMTQKWSERFSATEELAD